MFTKHVGKELSAYCNNELALEESRRVREHLLGCQRCRREYEEIKLGVDFAQQLPLVSAPESLWKELETLLDAQAPAASRVRRPWFNLTLGWSGFATAAAVALLIIGIALALYYTRHPAGGKGQARVPETPEVVPSDNEKPKLPEQKPQIVPTPQQQPKLATNPGRKHPPRGWEVNSLEGTPKIGDRLARSGQLSEGEWVETDSRSRAIINIADIGQVEVDQNSRVRLLRTRPSEHRIALAEGRLHAKITAPPRLFFVDTPSAVAVDLGCAYTLSVDDTGATRLQVDGGWVMLVHNGRESKVPVDAVCVTQPGIGPGTPYFEDASPAFLQALTRFDFEKGTDDVLRVVLAESRKRDTITLINLLNWAGAGGEQRSRVYDRLAELVPPPDGVTKPGVMKFDKHMLEEWMKKLTWVW